MRGAYFRHSLLSFVLLSRARKCEGSGLHSARSRLSKLTYGCDRTVLLRFDRFRAFGRRICDGVRLVFVREQYPWKPLTITGCSSAKRYGFPDWRTARFGRNRPRVDISKFAALRPIRAAPPLIHDSFLSKSGALFRSLKEGA